MSETPKRSSMLRAAVEALGQGGYQEAVRFCKQILKQDRYNYDAFLVLGKALFFSKQYDQADISYRRAVDINATGLRAWQGLAEVHEASGDTNKLVEACETIVKICKDTGDVAHLAEYTRKLAVAKAAILDYSKACETWQALLEMDSLSTASRLEASCGIIDAEAALMESHIQKECEKQIAQKEKADSDLIRQFLEDDWARSDSCKRMEASLEEVIMHLPEAHKYQNLLLRILVFRMRATSSSQGQDWKRTRLKVLRLCLATLALQLSDLAVEILFAMCEEDNMDESFKELGIPQLAQHQQKRISWLGKQFVHFYPGHGLVLSALAFAMHNELPHLSSLERRRSYCEHALRLDENSITGWRVLAELRAAEGAHSSAVECVRRGIQVVDRLRSIYGLCLQCAEFRLRLTLAHMLLNTGSYNEADEIFQEVIKVAESMHGSQGLMLLTSALEGQTKVSLAAGKPEEAFARLSSLLAIDANNAWAVAEKGWLAFQKGSFDQAKYLLEQAVASKPNNANYHYRLGLLYWKAGSSLQSDKEKALSHLLESAKLDSGQPEVFRILGHYYKEQVAGTQRSIRCYQKAVILHPDDEETGEALCNMLDNEGQEVLEIAVCREACQLSSRAFWAWRRLGYIQVFHKQWGVAIGNLQHAIRGYPSCRDLWEALGLAYQQLGMLTASLKAYARAIALEDCSSVFAMQQSGIILLLLGSHKKAVSMFRSALEKAPAHLVALYGLASALLGEARECIAIAAFGWSTSLLKEASEVVSSSTAYYSYSAPLWKLRGDIEVTYAKNLPLEHIDEVKGTTEVEQRGCGLLLDSWNQQRLLGAENARRAYQQALHLQPCQGNLYGDLCISLKLISFFSKKSCCSLPTWSVTETAACCGLSLEGTNSDLWTALGVLARHKGLRQHALIQALRVDGNHAVAWAHLGQLYLEEGREELAKQAFDHARTVDPSLGLTWAGMSHLYSKRSHELQEAFASCLYAVQLSPMAEFQLGLAQIGACSQQLHSAQVYAAVEQAVLQAPHRPEAHNFKGLICELHGNFDRAIRAFEFAHNSLMSSSVSNSSSLEHRFAISVNLARTFCKAGKAHEAVAEYKLLANSGKLGNDASTIRGYAVALWQLGRENLATAMVKRAVKVAERPSAVSCALILLCKFIYLSSGSASAVDEICNAQKIMQSDVELTLTLFAVASAGGMYDLLVCLVSNSGVLFKHERAPEFLTLMATGRQISEGITGKLDKGNTKQLLQKTLHIYPQSASVRRKLVQTLLETSSGWDANLAARCCLANSLKLLDPAESAFACEMSASIAVACNACGGMKSRFTFPCCSHGGNSCSTLLELQRWLHVEPWNFTAHYYMILCLLQEARENRFPSHISQCLQRMASTIIHRLPYTNENGKPWAYMHQQLMLCASETALQVGEYGLAVEKVETSLAMQLSSECQFLAHLQLARCHAAREDQQSLEAECKKCHQINTRNPMYWLSLVDLEMQHGLQGRNWSVLDIALQGNSIQEERVWKSLFEFKRAEHFLRVHDILSAEKTAAQASSLLPEATALHLLHGAICMELIKQGTGSQFLASAIRSLSRAKLPGGNVLPVVYLLLAQAEASKPGGLSKWEKYLQREWSAWPADLRPAELFFQMGLLAKRSKATTSDTSGPNSFHCTRSWIKTAVHLNPACSRYWTVLQQIRGNGALDT